VGRLAVAVLVALSALSIATGAPVGPWLDRVSGAEPRAIFDVTLPAGADASAVEATWRARLKGRVRSVERGATAADRVVTVACDGTDLDCYEVLPALFRTGVLEVREVHASTRTMRELYARLQTEERPDIVPEIDVWLDDATGAENTDWFVVAADVDAVGTWIDDMIASGKVAPLAEDEDVVFERIGDYIGDGRPWLRSYVVGGAPVITGVDVVETRATWNPDMEVPQATLTLSDEGARRFGEATARLVGRKVAWIVDGRVVFAPVIAAPIPDGRLDIGPSPGTEDEQMLEIDGLVRLLRGGPPLPDGIEGDVRDVVPASRAKRWIARGVLAALAAALAWILATLIARSTTAAPRVVATRRGSARALAVPIAVTVVGVGVIEYLAGVFLPGLTLHLRDMVDGFATIDDARRPVSPVALGATPVVTAYMLVELVAWAIPALRARRLGTSVERAPLELAVAIAAFVLALMQSYFILQWLRTTGGDGRFPALEDGALVDAGIVASLVGGVAIHAVVAQLITRHGLCNGWLVLVAYGALRNLPHDHVVRGLVLLGAVIAVGLTARRAKQPDARRLPVAGLVPAALIPTIIGLLALPYVMSAWTNVPLMQLLNKDALQIGLACGVAVLLSLRRGTPAPVAMLTAIGLSALIAGFPLAFPELGVGDPLLAGAIAGVLCAELADGARRRLATDTVPLVVIHDVERADEYVDLLRAKDIAAFPTGARARGLYRGLGAFVPVTILVPRERAEDAARILRLP
jgi:hypothetical protein